MNRRDGLKLMALFAATGALPALVTIRGANPIAIYDGRFAEARAFARKAQRAYDCRQDAAGLWFSRFAGRGGHDGQIIGLTSAADAMVLADCARREGLRFATLRLPRPGETLIAWTIARRGLG